MNPGLSANTEELKKLAGHLNDTVTEFRATADYLTQLGARFAASMKGESGNAAQVAMNEFVSALSELAAEEERIAEKVNDFAKTLAAGEGLRATSITQTLNG
ncbi:WXG100 family type VII secretion target [Mycobacteroides franklinii]|uniref:WXG100 family type VII secretion target n=1 Tax=Mycobacteroides franklinii TaxID=948102 RepID=UPI0009934021|nr:WXG100 family type VII secretion target [Mycobacteroides franklinii]